MKIADRKSTFFQGDLMLIPVDAIPEGVEEVKAEGENYVVAHSETGHHHVVSARVAKLYMAGAMVMYLRAKEVVDVRHLRPVDKHETLRLPPGDWKLLRQREGTPEGWRRVED